MNPHGLLHRVLPLDITRRFASCRRGYSGYPGFVSHLLWPPRDPDRLRRFRDKRLRKLVRHVYDRVPFYRRLMDEHGLRPQDIRGLHDLHRFPVSRKADLKQLIPEVLASGLRTDKLVKHATSGSTGQPLKIYRSWFEERMLGAYRWRVLWEYGYRPHHLHVEVEELQPQENGDDRWLHALCQRFGLFRQIRVQALQDPERILDRLITYEPHALTGYAGVLYRVATTALEQGEIRVRPRFVACHSDQLTEGMRRQISRAFAAPVYELYDAYETNIVAWQCPQHDGLHTADSCAVVEVVGADGKVVASGERGEIVLTNLISLSMPFIRFAIGDLARRGASCICGRPSQRLEAVEGRTVEYFALPDGRVVHPYEIYAQIGDPQWIRKYQLVQFEIGRFCLRVVPEQSLARDELDAIRRRISAFLGPQVDFNLELIPRLEPSPTGKEFAFRSLVGSGAAHP